MLTVHQRPAMGPTIEDVPEDEQEHPQEIDDDALRMPPLEPQTKPHAQPQREAPPSPKNAASAPPAAEPAPAPEAQDEAEVDEPEDAFAGELRQVGEVRSLFFERPTLSVDTKVVVCRNSTSFTRC